MEHEHGTGGGERALTSRLKVTGQNVRFTDPVVGEKTIGSLSIGPILAYQRNALAHGASHLGHQFAEPLVQAFVGKAAAGELAIKPRVDLLSIGTAPSANRHQTKITVDSRDTIVCALRQPIWLD